ncbi:hypothetical protein TUM17386_35990 [Shewanella algae]|nr:hypothetical protein TUM17386_35990 [Shewanella algae]
MKITTIGLDIAKLVFHAVAVNKAGKLVRKKMLKRKEVLGFSLSWNLAWSRLKPVVALTIGTGKLLPLVIRLS